MIIQNCITLRGLILVRKEYRLSVVHLGWQQFQYVGRFICSFFHLWSQGLIPPDWIVQDPIQWPDCSFLDSLVAAPGWIKCSGCWLSLLWSDGDGEDSNCSTLLGRCPELCFFFSEQVTAFIPSLVPRLFLKGHPYRKGLGTKLIQSPCITTEQLRIFRNFKFKFWKILSCCRTP